MSKNENPMGAINILQSHRNFWNNSPGLVLRRTEPSGIRDPLRSHISNENIKGEFTPKMVDTERIVKEITLNYQDRPLLCGDTFQNVSFAKVIPWMEAIIGCQIYSLGKGGASMVANPPNIEPNDLSMHLRYVLDNIEENVWFKKLSDGYEALAEALGNKLPIVQTLLRGPGDMMGALLGHENFIWRMMKPADNEDFLEVLLDLCAKIYIKTAKIELEHAKEFKGGYCNEWGIWAPRLNVRIQEDEASLVSPKLYNKFLLPYHIQEVAAFDYSTMHMHSGYVKSVYNWKEFSKESTIGAFEVGLDPNGPTTEDLVETLLGINSEKPLIIDICNEEQERVIEKHNGDFPGSILHCKATPTLGT